MWVAIVAAILWIASAAQARPLGYRDADGQWRVIESTQRPAVKGDLKGGTVQLTATDIDFQVRYLDVIGNTNKGFDDPVDGADRRATVQAVLEYLDSVLDETSVLEIDFLVSQEDGDDALASGGSFFDVFGPFSEPLSLQHIKTGVDPDPDVPDIEVTVDFGWNWNNTTDPNTAGKADLYSVMLHELTHGLGMASLSKSDGASEFTNQNPTWVALTTFDEQLYSAGGVKLWNTFGNFMASSSVLIGANGGVVYRGANATATFGSFPPIYTPNPFDSSSMSHWNSGLIPDPVMSRAITVGAMKRTYRPFELGMLEDLGYDIEQPPLNAVPSDAWKRYR